MSLPPAAMKILSTVPGGAIRRPVRQLWAAPATFLLAAIGLAGCATPPPAGDADAAAAFREANDPIEPLNRFIFEFNRGVDQVALRPAAEVYRGVLPQGVRDSVRNFVDNLKSPVVIANMLLQGKPERAGDTLGRFMANTFIGVGGLFDVAPNLNRGQEDLGQTFATWGADSGPYLVLPLLGPSNLRDTAGLIGDNYLLDPINWWARNTDREWLPLARGLVDGIDLRSRNIETLDEIERTSIDFYAAIRSLYRQRRKDAIHNGDPTRPESRPNLLSRFEDDGGLEGSRRRLQSAALTAY